MTTAITAGQIINECRSEIWESINTLKAQKDFGNADSLVLEAARCGDVHDWMCLREEALMMAAG
jgi:hypothetical protein